MPSRKSVFLIWVTLAAGCAAPSSTGSIDPASASTEDLLEHARAILRDTPLIDGHNDLPWQYHKRVNNRLDQLDLADDLTALDNPTHTDIPRLRAGGVGGQFWSAYIPIAEHEQDRVETGLAAWRAANPPPDATLAQVVDHIDHIRDVAGIDHLGIGSDYDGMPPGPVGLEDVSCYPNLIVELLRRGYRDDEIRKIIGRNVLRVMRKAERVSARLRRSRPPSDVTREELDGQ